jgi:hypothetical protein
MRLALHVAEAWAAALILFVVFRAWAGGMFETGLEGWLLPFTKADKE